MLTVRTLPTAVVPEIAGLTATVGELPVKTPLAAEYATYDDVTPLFAVTPITTLSPWSAAVNVYEGIGLGAVLV